LTCLLYAGRVSIAVPRAVLPDGREVIAGQKRKTKFPEL
jgi:hypothetical protein